MPKTYDPHSVEKRLYDWWEAQGYFRPETQVAKGLADPTKPAFVITMPPPNITGALHLGHAMTAAIEDLMIRYHRMRGHLTLWLPGSDHASIATHSVIERDLARRKLDHMLLEIGYPLDKGSPPTTRQDLGREWFLKLGWAWKKHYGARITEQHRRLGASCDWQRERFTLDPDLSRAVRETFVRLYKQGLIYRGAYLINWCPRCRTAVSDLEVIHQEESTHLWYVRYPLINHDWSGPQHPWRSGRWAEGATEWIQVATTRPETILGDTAVAVNPFDSRYTNIVGRTAVLPALSRRIPIIADQVVDPEFGTGAVKVTPAHDPTDYEIGQRHGLEAPDVMTDDGLMSDLAGPYTGQHRYECRRNLVNDLEKEGLLVKIQDYDHAVGHCQRCDTIVEPRISTQWFVKIQPLAEAALAAVRDGRIRIVPQRFDKIYFNWLENIRDWCISRQLWWGHRIPVWYCDDCGGQTCETTDPTLCLHCGSPNIHQDEDVLDTWFSSGLWPFSTLGWPDDTEDLRRFYPNTVRETGYDILFFWVAREIMLGLAMMNEIPFRVVYLHGLIRNEKGLKISKSMPDAEKYDPLYIIETYGCDALRYTLTTSSSPGNDMNLDPRRIEGARNFANKIWNAARFVIANISDFGFQISDWTTPPSAIGNLQLPDRWILSRHNRLIVEATRLIEDYQFGEAGRQINEFLWGDYCDWYIEACKPRLCSGDPTSAQTARSVLVHVLDRTLRLLHPYMPYVTEEIWQHLKTAAGGGQTWGEALIVAPWPEPGPIDEAAETEMSVLIEVIRGIRNARAEYNVEPGRRIPAVIAAGDKVALLQEQRLLLTTLAHLDDSQLILVPALEEKPRQAATVVVGAVEIYLPLAGLVDLEAERARLSKAIARVEAEIARSEGLLNNEKFMSRAPADVVQRERNKLVELREEHTRLAQRLAMLQ